MSLIWYSLLLFLLVIPPRALTNLNIQFQIDPWSLAVEWCSCGIFHEYSLEQWMDLAVQVPTCCFTVFEQNFNACCLYLSDSILPMSCSDEHPNSEDVHDTKTWTLTYQQVCITNFITKQIAQCFVFGYTVLMLVCVISTRFPSVGLGKLLFSFGVCLVSGEQVNPPLAVELRS